MNLRRKRGRTILRISIGMALVVVGASLAFFLYTRAGDGGFFQWDVARPYSPLVAALIGGGSAVLLGLWVMNSWGRLRFRHSGDVLVSISLVWMGFGAGMFGPALVGEKGSWESGSSVVYSFELERVSMPAELVRFWSGANSGPYIAAGPENRLWIALNSSPTPYLSPLGSSAFEGEVAVASFQPDLEWEFGKLVNLTEMDSRIQQVRDIQWHGNKLVFSNVEVKSNCMVLQIWTADLEPDGDEVRSVELVWESSPCLEPRMSAEEKINGLQSGGRLAINEDGHYLIAVGDFRMGLSVHKEYEGRPDPLGTTGSYGKILRVEPGGSASIVSSGHRNPQGLFLDFDTDRLWSSEHGPNAGGELNLVVEGADYGWPDTTYGVPYSANLPESDWQIGRWGSHHEGFMKPILAWMPSIAPSQLIVYGGSHFPAWNGDILLATLKDESLRRIRLDGERVVFDEKIFIGERVRDLIELDDGRLILSFDSGRFGVMTLPTSK